MSIRQPLSDGIIDLMNKDIVKIDSWMISIFIRYNGLVELAPAGGKGRSVLTKTGFCSGSQVVFRYFERTVLFFNIH